MRSHRVWLLLATCALLGCSKKNETPAVASAAPSASAPTASASAPPPPTTRPASTGAPAADSPCSRKAKRGKLAARETACAEGDGKVCNNLGSAWAEGKHGVPCRDYAKAKAFYQKACDLKDPLGCFNLANVYRLGEGAEVDMARAMALFQKSCDLGEAKGCTELAIIFYEGTVTPKDTATAIKLLQRACKLGSEVGCKDLELLKKRAR